MDSSLCEADRNLLVDPEIAIFFQKDVKDVKEAFAQGVRGPADEAILLYKEWGFNVAEIDMRVLIIHGGEDKFAPYSFAEYLHQTIPNSVLKAYPKQGHLFLITAFDKIFRIVTKNS